MPQQDSQGTTHAQVQQIVRHETATLRLQVEILEKQVADLRQANSELRRGIREGRGLDALEELWLT